jgi:3-oxoacyl-[acyl-carrier-protein] synthase-3
VTVPRSFVLGSGGYLPEKILTNADLAKIVDTSDEWIRQRTGIRERHIAADGELTSDLAVFAARKALTVAGLEPNDIDMIVMATATPDNTFPAAAVTVQENSASRAAPPSMCRRFALASSTVWPQPMRCFVPATPKRRW